VRRDRLRAVPLLGSSTTGSTASGAPRHSRRRAECELAVSSARLLDLAHFRSFALTQLGQLTTGNLLGAKTLLEEAIEEAENAGPGWFIAFANVALADVRRQQENPADAESLLQEVLDWGCWSRCRRRSCHVLSAPRRRSSHPCGSPETADTQGRVRRQALRILKSTATVLSSRVSRVIANSALSRARNVGS
jgi:hypothetical protein